MPRPAAHAPERFIAILGEIVGSEWSPPSVPDWPVNFTRPAADRALTVYPDRKNSRIIFTTAAVTAPGRRCHAKCTPDLAGHDDIDSWLADGDLDAVADALGVVVQRLVDQPLPEPATPTPTRSAGNWSSSPSTARSWPGAPRSSPLVSSAQSPWPTRPAGSRTSRS